MSSEKLPRYYVGEPNDVGWANIGDREFIGYGEPCDHSGCITVYGHYRDGVNTGHRYATELAAKLNGASDVVASAPVFAAGPTQRQLYKAAALQALVSNHLYMAGPVGFSARQFADDSGKIADAMLAEDEEHEKK